MRRPSSSALLVLVALALASGACGPDQPSRSEDPGRVVEGGRDLKEDPQVLSPPIVGEPIYECASGVTVQGFIPGAKLTIFADGNPIGGGVSNSPSGQAFTVGITFTKGQMITAVQEFGGVTSQPSAAVGVRSHKDDYPGGIPKPRVDPPPLYRCGRAIGARDVVPGSKLDAQSEPALQGGGFGPSAVIGSVTNSGAAQWMTINPPYGLGDRVRVQYQICADVSPPSDPQIVQQQPAVIPPPTVDPVYEGATSVVVRNVLNGALLTVLSNNQQIGSSPTPGGTGQAVGINPPATANASITAIQALCDKSQPSTPVTVKPCAELPAAKIKQPQPDDTQVEVTEFVPGSRIIIFADGVEIGDGGGPLMNLVRPVKAGEVITVVQRLGACQSEFVYVVPVACAVGTDPLACSRDWPAFRHNSMRNAQQTKASGLSDPFRVRTLKVKWSWQPSQAAAFRASPIVWNGRVYIGNGNGRLYALDAVTGNVLWQYPSANAPALTSRFTCNPSSDGIASSAAIARIDNRDAVIFGAPDRSIGAGLGSGRLFALDAVTGAEIWKSPEIAVLDGLTDGSTSERHEQIGYASPLVLGNRVYIGVANHCDNPIQNGRVVAVDLNNGTIVGGFTYSSTSTRGGGVWSSAAGGVSGELYITTGNTRSGNPGGEPRVNHGLAMLRLDATTGAVIWKLQPVPFALDGDPDWASGPTVISAGCGALTVSTMKDGWTYAAEPGGGKAGPPSVRWQFPPTGFPFTPGDGTTHGDSRYLVPGAAWRDVFFTMTAGENVTTRLTDGYSRLHALNVCGPRTDRVRWLLDVPGVDPGTGNDRPPYRLGPPSVTRGIVFVGTHQGRLIVVGDPTVEPPSGSRCSHPDVPPADCVANGFTLVPVPSVLANIQLDANRAILTEPVLARGRVYVSTTGSNLYMLEP
jgi:outer membrane protein assembly factor BamB